MSRDELIERFSLARVQPSPATFDYKKLDWMNGVYLRAMSEQEFAATLANYLREQGFDWDEELVRRTAPLVQEKIAKLGDYPEFARFFFEEVQVDAAQLDGSRPVLEAARATLREVEPFVAERIEAALRSLAERLELSPRKAFEPIRIAVTGSRVSPGLFESLELLGRETSVERIRNARVAAA
jgi:glutamyl-tRNA synthetase